MISEDLIVLTAGNEREITRRDSCRPYIYLSAMPCRANILITGYGSPVTSKFYLLDTNEELLQGYISKDAFQRLVKARRTQTHSSRSMIVTVSFSLPIKSHDILQYSGILVQMIV